MNRILNIKSGRVCIVFLFYLMPLFLYAQEQEPDEGGIGGTGHESPMSLDDAIFSRPDMPEINEIPEVIELEPPRDIEEVGEASAIDDASPGTSDTVQ